MTRVLLITGARSLADDPAAEAWARCTEHTASLARAAGLTVDAQTWGSR